MTALFLLLLFASPAFADLRDDAAAAGWLYGCAASAQDLDSISFRAVLARECGILSSTVGGKMRVVTPQPGLWDFSDLDRVAAFAQSAGQQLHIHTLVWPRPDKNPTWLSKLPAAQRRPFLRLYVRRVLSRYPEARYVDVVNEPLSFPGNLWEQAMGEGYLDVAFAEARRASTATLVLNEYGLEWDTDKQEAMLALLKRLKARGVPVDALGLESHLQVMPRRGPLRRFVRRVKKLGIEVIVTELDVRGSSSDAYVADVYARYLRLLRLMGVRIVQTWGLRDSPTEHERRLPLDYFLHPKPAYWVLHEAFGGKP